VTAEIIKNEKGVEQASPGGAWQHQRQARAGVGVSSRQVSIARGMK